MTSARRLARGVSLLSSVLPPALYEQFQPPWNGNLSPDGKWRIAGTWTGTGNNTLDPANAQLLSTYSGESGGFLTLTSTANQYRGAEIQTLDNYLCHYGYYEVRMKVTSVPGVCASFFWKEKDYAAGEIDIEFLPREFSGNTGKVRFTIHPDWATNNTVKIQNLSFNPSAAFHRYGFLWTASKIAYIVDAADEATFNSPPAGNIANPNGGYIMMNSWTNTDADWAAGPPAQDATTIYDWVKYYPGVTTVQP